MNLNDDIDFCRTQWDAWEQTAREYLEERDEARQLAEKYRDEALSLIEAEWSTGDDYMAEERSERVLPWKEEK